MSYLTRLFHGNTALSVVRKPPEKEQQLRRDLAVQDRRHPTRVLGFAFLASVITGLICGLAPALQSTRPNLVRSLKSPKLKAFRTRHKMRRLGRRLLK